MASKNLVTEALVKKVAHLAQLYLTPQEVTKFKSQLTNIFGYVETVKAVRTKDTVGTAHATTVTNRFRQDLVTQDRMLTQEEALSQAKRTHNGYFVVKAIFSEV